jgi:hypothetical protein
VLSIFSRAILPGLALCAGLALASRPAAAQLPDSAPAAARTGPRVLNGRVLKKGVPVAGASVTLHRVTSAASGPVSTVASADDGGFRFTLPPADTGFSVFFTTVDYLTVRYFGPPVHTDEAGAGYQVAVYDTTSSLPGAVKTARRDVVLMPQNDGGWEVDEVIRVRNTGDLSLVASPGSHTWEFQLPTSAVDFEAGEGDVAPDQLRLVGDRVFLLASLVPGDREIFVRYRLPAGAESAITLPDGVDTMNVFVRQPSPEITVAPLVARPPVAVEGENFLQFSGTNLQPGTKLALAWVSPTRFPISPVTAGIGAAVLLLALGTAAAVRNRNLSV